MDFIPVRAGDAPAIERLSRIATEIVRDYYDPIIGPAQNTYMLEKFQSVPAIRGQLAEGYAYCIAEADGRPVGFLGFYPRGDALYLSKLYLYAAERGRGYGRQMLDFVRAAARAAGLAAVELNVNVHNPTVEIYEKLGFVRIRSEKNDIGCGYYMDDYVYRLALE